jgi:hypothetical protein
VQLFKEEKLTKTAWLYLDRLKKQERCFAQLDCMFKHGAVLYENSSTERLLRGDLGKKMSGNKKSDNTHVGERLLSKGDLDNKTLPKDVVKETVGKEKSAKDVRYHLVDDLSYDRGGSSSDESEWDDDVVNGEGLNWQNADVGR